MVQVLFDWSNVGVQVNNPVTFEPEEAVKVDPGGPPVLVSVTVSLSKSIAVTLKVIEVPNLMPKDAGTFRVGG
jgi:hypothetical protein